MSREEKDWPALGLGPQPVPEDKRIFNRPSNQQPISQFFDEIAQAAEDTERDDNDDANSKQGKELGGR